MSESPEEQPSTGVLGRIGSWFSPWRGKGPKNPSENASPSSDQAVKSEGQEERDESVKPQAREQQWEEEEEQNSNPSLPGLYRDIFPNVGEDATQSAHRDGSVVCSPETAEGGPRGEEFVGIRKQRIGQGKGREESSNGTSVSGSPERNASHLTHLCSSSEQGVVWDSAHTQSQAQSQAHAQTGRRLHVYLEETSVIQGGQDTRAGQKVVRTKFSKSLHVLRRAKSSPTLDAPESSTSTENKRTNVETKSQYSALGEVSLKLNKDSQFELKLNKEQTEADNMGRKNATKRKSKKNSQGDGGKGPPNAEPVPEGFPTSDNALDSPQGESPKTHMGESSANSSSKHNPTSQASPGVGESKTSCADTVKQLDTLQDSNLAIAANLECVVDGTADMEDDDSLYKVERKTETPESKRRSIKVSQSEVKVFAKNVPLNSKQTPARNLKTKDETKDKSRTETDARVHGWKKTDEECKPVTGRIADKISLFERPAGAFNKQTSQTSRSADVSPVRKATEKLKADSVLLDQRSRSAERYDRTKSSSASPAREMQMTIKERARKFTDALKTDDKTAVPSKPAMTGMSKKSASSVAAASSKSQEQDSQGKPDAKDQIQAKAVSEIALKPDLQDMAALEGAIFIPKEQPTDSKSKDTVASKTANQGAKPNSVEANVRAKGSEDSSEMTGNISQQSKGPGRTGSRSKRRKSREATSPLSPNSENKPDHKPLVTAITQEQVDDTKEPASASIQLTEKVTLPSDEAKGNTPDEQPLPDAKQRAFKKELEVLDKQSTQLDSSLKKENIDKPGGVHESELSVNKDEVDTAACSSGTKTPIDKDPVSLPQKEEKAMGHSLSFTQEREKASKDSRETPAPSSSPSSSVVEQPVEKQEPPVTIPKLDIELAMQSEPKSKEKVREPSKIDTGQTQQPHHEDTQQLNEAEREDEKTRQADKKEKETAHQLLCSDKSTTKVKGSDSGQDISATEGSVVRDDERKNAERKEKTPPVKDERKTETSQREPVSESSEKTSLELPAQTQQVRQMTIKHPQNAAVGAVTQTNEEAVSGTKKDKESSKGEMASKMPAELPKVSTESLGTKTESVVIAAEPQPDFVLVEKVENTPDDSCARGANDAEFSSAKPIAKAAAAVEELTVKATNDNPLLISAQTDGMVEKHSSGKESTPMPVSKSLGNEGAGLNDENCQTVKSVPSEVRISGDIMKITPGHPQGEASRNIKSKSDISSLKGAEKMEPHPADSTASTSTANVVEKTAEKTTHSAVKELSSVANGNIPPHPQLHTVKNNVVESKPSQTPKTSTSPEANKLIPEPSQRSSPKKLHFPRGLSKDDSATWQDTPSSWLDVDVPKQKLKSPMPKLSSSISESNLLDTSGELDDDDFIEKIKNLCAPFSLPPRKHNPLRPPQPPFVMPAIKEDRFEKTFDPEEFKFGLSRKNKFTIDTIPSTLAKLQNMETKLSIKPARASLADRSILLSSLDTNSRLKEKTSVKNEEDVKEEKDDQIKVKSRLEGSCVFSSLNSSFRGKRNGVQKQEEGTNSGGVSPSEAPLQSPPPVSQPPTPSPTALSPAPLKDTLAKQSPAPSNREEDQAVNAVVSDSGPPLPSFNDIKLPDYLEKYLPREPAKPVQSIQGQEKVTPEIPPITHPTLPELKQPLAQPEGILNKKKRAVRGFHKRPGKMVLFEKTQFSGQAYEIYRDVADASSLQLSPVISVKVIRGCWVLYEKPDFQGRPVALEEGGTELTNMWAEPGLETEPMLIGSIRLAVWDYSIPHIDLFTEPEGLGRVTPYRDDTIETGSFGIPLSTASIQVHSGVWLVYSDPGFEGMLAVLEAGVYPFPETWGFPSPFVGSLRPLKIGGFKVENPSEVKAVVYEKPGFEGSCVEIDNEVFSFCESEGGMAADGGNFNPKKLKTVGSLKIIGGLWVGYSEPGFEGQQHILEEGEYLDPSDWGSSEQLLSLRPILSDFLSPHLKMFSDRDFSERGVNIDLTVPVINMEDTGYGMKTHSIDVIDGVWVVFDEPGFCGEPYILERGMYGSPEDWGALQPRVASVMPVVLDDFENTAKFKVQLFSEPGFQGPVLVLEESVSSLEDGFTVASCKVLAGSWLAFEGQDFAGRMYVLEVGNYSDLRAMGCVHAGSSILSLQTVGFEFSLPSITLFERCGLRGKRVIVTDATVNLQLAGACSRVQSVLVEGGIWVLYEGINYRGSQILLKPGEVSDWRKLSSWQKIGSLRPLMQKQVHFRLRNRQTRLMMSVTGDLEDVKLMRVQETEETGGYEQIWFYYNGHLHCKLLEECCLSPSGSVTLAGSRVGLTPERDDHLWSITPEGFICYTPTSNLVLEIKGGHHYDKNQVILNTLDPKKLQQRWDVEII
uniref:beta/gamma crystallin domain-containing protein 1-like isoform X2 n=1 Tax=Scatophagus argus TaxID=75038 RepID=UPI001ED82621|nr:beta/gamma crystallin domain-containing protein 1-like isoform X2 [Scatophagus argus]